MRALHSLLALLAPALAARPVAVAASSGDELQGRALAAWLAEIQPAPAELEWTAIPWRASFGSAVLEAEEQAQPVLLWAMNGHPLGCT